MSNLNVLISGSGIAGGVFAYWLLRAHPNANITIVERDPTIRLTGASVDIRTSAVDIIKWMGVEHEIRKHTTKEEGLEILDLEGKTLATFRASGNSDIQSFTSEFEIFRGALAKVFIDLVSTRVKFIFDDYVSHYEQHEDGVIVTFEKSKEIKTYDLLVAADGLGSKIRGMMLNTKLQDKLYEEGEHVAFFTIKKDLLKGDRLAKWYSSPGGRAILLRPDPDPAGRTRGNLMCVTKAGDLEKRNKLNKALREGNESYMNLMEEIFGDVGWLVPEVLQGMRESDDFYCSLFGQIRSPKVQDGRVVLVGDSGYATPGMGTSLAIVGGYILAGELLSHPGDIKTALERYESIMLSFVKGEQRGGFGMQLLNPQTESGIKLRNYFLWFVEWSQLNRIMFAAAGWLGIKEKKVPMPNYQWPAE